MILYSYKAINIEGKIHTGQYWCADKNDLTRKLRERQLYLLAFADKRGDKILHRLPLKQLSVVCRYFHSLLSSGIDVVSAIGIIEKHSTSKVVKKSLKEIQDMLEQGIELSDCMRLYPNIYPNFLVSMVRIGEESGRLDEVFLKLTDIYENEDRLRNKIIKALLYPSILFIVSTLIIQFMILVIMPIFIDTLANLKGTLPLLSRIVFSAGIFINSNYILLLFVVLALGILIIYSSKKALIKKLLLKTVIKDTVLGKNIAKAEAVKFSRYLGILLISGTHILKALDIVGGELKDNYLKDILKKTIQQIKNGGELAVSLESISEFPPVLCEMIRIGETTGTLDNALLKASDIMEEELYNFIDKLTVLIEPILIIFISLFIGIILAAFLLPMISIMDAV